MQLTVWKILPNQERSMLSNCIQPELLLPICKPTLTLKLSMPSPKQLKFYKPREYLEQAAHQLKQ